MHHTNTSEVAVLFIRRFSSYFELYFLIHIDLIGVLQINTYLLLIMYLYVNMPVYLCRDMPTHGAA